MPTHRPRKRFGQNFLVDRGVVDAIVDAIAPRPGDRLVEIGPGLGALTRALLDRLDPASLPLHVVEIDRDLVARLRTTYAPEVVEIHAGDALAFDFGALASRLGAPLRVVGNLPYNISSPLLFHLAARAGDVRDQHFMLQREVVERMVAAPGDGAFGRLSVMLQYRYAMEPVLEVPPEAFDPPPQVHSAVVRMVPRDVEALHARDESAFAQVVAAGFSQRRKMLRNTLAAPIAAIGGEAEAIALGLRPTARAEEVPVEVWVALANRLVSARRAAS